MLACLLKYQSAHLDCVSRQKMKHPTNKINFSAIIKVLQEYCLTPWLFWGIYLFIFVVVVFGCVISVSVNV